MYDIALTRLVWFRSIGTDALAHTVARELINRDKYEHEKLLWIVRRYQ